MIEWGTQGVESRHTNYNEGLHVFILTLWGLGMASRADVRAAAELPAVPLTLEGYSVLHQMFRFKWAEWRKFSDASQPLVVREMAEAFGELEQSG